MDRHQRLRQFVDENIQFLASTQATKDAVKKLRQAFFEKHHLATEQRFTTAEVASDVVKLVVKAKRDLDEDLVVDQCRSIPFIKASLPKNEIAMEHRLATRGSESILSASDLRELKQESHLQKVEAQFNERAHARAEEYLQRQREELEKQQQSVTGELNKLQKATSKLDGPPPAIDLEEEVLQSTVAPLEREGSWWEELSLEADPFPTDRGLVGIPEEKHDQIVVETGFMKGYLEMVKDSSYFLGKTIVLTGEFGSGKTTLFSVCQRRLGLTRTLPVTVIMNPSANVGGLMVEFVSQLCEQVCDAHVEAGGRDLRREIGGARTLSELGGVLKEAQSRRIGEKVVVFIDGLHKGGQYTKEVFEFLQQLQNTLEYIEGQGTEVGIIIAGTPDWQMQFDRTPSLSGSVHHFDAIPSITEDEAVEAAIRRILAFVRPGAAQPPVRKEPLRLAYRALRERKSVVTFRNFLNHIHNRLRARHFDELGLSIEPQVETIDLVRNFILTSRLRDGYLRLEKETGSRKRARQHVPILLSEVYASRGLREGSGKFLQNQKMLHILASTGFIEKALKHDTLYWQVSRDLGEILQQLYDKHQVLPIDAIAALLQERTEAIRAEVRLIYETATSAFRETAAANHESWPELAADVEAVAAWLQEIEESIERKGPSGVDPDLIARSTTAAMRLLTWAAAGSPSAEGVHLEDTWIAPENLDDFYMFQRTTAIPNGTSQAFGMFHGHADIMTQAATTLRDLTLGESIARINGRTLTKEDRDRVHQARLAFLKQDFRGAINICYNHVELKIRRTVFARMRLMAGNKAEEHLPPDIRKALHDLSPNRGHPRAKRTRDRNFLYEVSRSEYSKIIFSKKVMKIVGFGAMRAIDIHRLRESVELTFSIADREAHGDRAQYFREHATEIGDCVKSMPRICEVLNRGLLAAFDNEQMPFEKSGNGLRFKPRTANGAPTGFEFDVSASDVERVVRGVLERVEDREEPVDLLLQFLSVPGCEVEHQLAIIAVMGSQKLVSVDASSAHLSITEHGRDKLRRLRRTPQMRLDERFEPAA